MSPWPKQFDAAGTPLGDGTYVGGVMVKFETTPDLEVMKEDHRLDDAWTAYNRNSNFKAMDVPPQAWYYASAGGLYTPLDAGWDESRIPKNVLTATGYTPNAEFMHTPPDSDHVVVTTLAELQDRIRRGETISGADVRNTINPIDVTEIPYGSGVASWLSENNKKQGTEITNPGWWINLGGVALRVEHGGDFAALGRDSNGYARLRTSEDVQIFRSESGMFYASVPWEGAEKSLLKKYEVPDMVAVLKDPTRKAALYKWLGEGVGARNEYLNALEWTDPYGGFNLKIVNPEFISSFPTFAEYEASGGTVGKLVTPDIVKFSGDALVAGGNRSEEHTSELQ